MNSGFSSGRMEPVRAFTSKFNPEEDRKANASLMSFYLDSNEKKEPEEYANLRSRDNFDEYD